MIIRQNKEWFDHRDMRDYARGYWDGRFNGYEATPREQTNMIPYKMGFQHGEADYLEHDADFSPDPVFDDLDVVEQIKNHPL